LTKAVEWIGKLAKHTTLVSPTVETFKNANLKLDSVMGHSHITPPLMVDASLLLWKITMPSNKEQRQQQPAQRVGK
jgi:hypothetical protein